VADENCRASYLIGGQQITLGIANEKGLGKRKAVGLPSLVKETRPRLPARAAILGPVRTIINSFNFPTSPFNYSCPTVSEPSQLQVGHKTFGHARLIGHNNNGIVVSG
jgi:hypothetical protein